ncbi:MAG: DUF2142 domain-containing protein [Candidatus Fournierella pullistercoris]|uniref:DUF2142 domain-containing protein n=1 Tax=Candidatus Allofournierella pullistercoris TaxID=2838597 RepID=A0A948T320_9FIRM|nr:DUF2142 domain-containing protein [Candidatus Fournierella pullistercoris]
MKENQGSKAPSRWFWLAGWAVLCLLAIVVVYYWRVFYYLDGRMNAWLLTGGAVAFVSGVWLAVRALFGKGGWSDGKSAVCIFLCGAVFCFANPPLQAPDETQHYLRSYSVSMGWLNFDYNRTYPEDVAKLVESFPGAWVNSHTSQGMTEDEDGNPKAYTSAGYALKQQEEYGPVEGIQDGFAHYFSPEQAEITVQEPYFFMVISMLPQALGMALARMVGFGALGCLYAGRLVNLAAYSVLCWLALKNCARYKPAFLAMMLMPISLYMAASVSYDGTLLGFSYLVASYYCKEEIRTKDLALFLFAFVMMNLAKPYINLLWVMLPLVLPQKVWKTRWKKWQLAVAAVGLALVAGWLLSWYAGAFRMNYPPADSMRQENAGPMAQLLFVVKNPLRFVAVLLGTLYENDFFIGQMGVFGALDLPIGFINMVSPWMLLLAAALSVHEKSSLRTAPAIGLWVLSLGYIAAAMGGLYLTWTPVGMVRVIGLQARYFLPAFLMLTVLLTALLSHLLEPKLDKWRTKPLHSMLVLSGAFAVVSGVLLFQHYWIGPVFLIP